MGDQIRSFLRIWLHILRKSLLGNFIFYAVPQSEFPQYRMKLKLGAEVPFDRSTAWSVRNWSFSGPHFPAFELNTEKYGVSLILSECVENKDQKNSEYRHFSRSEGARRWRYKLDHLTYVQIVDQKRSLRDQIDDVHLNLPFREVLASITLSQENEKVDMKFEIGFSIGSCHKFWCCH